MDMVLEVVWFMFVFVVVGCSRTGACGVRLDGFVHLGFVVGWRRRYKRSAHEGRNAFALGIEGLGQYVGLYF